MCFFPSILWEQGGPLGVKGGTVDGWQEESVVWLIEGGSNKKPVINACFICFC